MCDNWAMDSLAGSLLVATPNLIDPNFFRTIVLLLQHDEEGCVGVVLNRPTEEPVDAHLPEWADLVPEPRTVNYGGPVEPSVAIGLSLSGEGMPTGVPGLSLIDLSAPPAGDGHPVRIYSGYSGWGSEQLETEIALGTWCRHRQTTHSTAMTVNGGGCCVASRGFSPWCPPIPTTPGSTE
jgi:putative transcriptional regulator